MDTTAPVPVPAARPESTSAEPESALATSIDTNISNLSPEKTAIELLPQTPLELTNPEPRTSRRLSVCEPETHDGIVLNPIDPAGVKTPLETLVECIKNVQRKSSSESAAEQRPILHSTPTKMPKVEYTEKMAEVGDPRETAILKENRDSNREMKVGRSLSSSPVRLTPEQIVAQVAEAVPQIRDIDNRTRSSLSGFLAQAVATRDAREQAHSNRPSPSHSRNHVPATTPSAGTPRREQPPETSNESSVHANSTSFHHDTFQNAKTYELVCYMHKMYQQQLVNTLNGDTRFSDIIVHWRQAFQIYHSSQDDEIAKLRRENEELRGKIKHILDTREQEILNSRQASNNAPAQPEHREPQEFPKSTSSQSGSAEPPNLSIQDRIRQVMENPSTVSSHAETLQGEILKRHAAEVLVGLQRASENTHEDSLGNISNLPSWITNILEMKSDQSEEEKTGVNETEESRTSFFANVIGAAVAGNGNDLNGMATLEDEEEAEGRVAPVNGVASGVGMGVANAPRSRVSKKRPCPICGKYVVKLPRHIRTHGRNAAAGINRHQPYVRARSNSTHATSSSQATTSLSYLTQASGFSQEASSLIAGISEALGNQDRDNAPTSQSNLPIVVNTSSGIQVERSAPSSRQRGEVSFLNGSGDRQSHPNETKLERANDERRKSNGLTTYLATQSQAIRDTLQAGGNIEIPISEITYYKSNNTQKFTGSSRDPT